MGRRKRKKYEVKKLDLHQVPHAKVVSKVENFIYNYETELPLEIITGNSDRMKEIVIETLKENKFDYELGDFFNNGYIIVK